MAAINRFSAIIPVILLGLFPGFSTSSANAVPVPVPLAPIRLSVPPVIDGDLSDEAWRQTTPLEPRFVTANPRSGENCPERTLVWMGYDDHNLYFAFRCFDSQPQRIRASLVARDKTGDDDGVAVSLDTRNTRQLTCQFMVNPHGIQRDTVNFDNDTRDWVWYSAGRLIPEGYEVELAIPLSSLRFQGGREVTMGILFGRIITRASITAVWPEVKPEQNPNIVHAPVVFRDLANPGALEVLPSFTYGSGVNRIRPGRWGNSSASREVGAGVKYSRSAALTLEATANPDFSHVESDAFQMDINRRYPVFYSEKRPFFMEGADIFELSRGGNNFSTTMHTRKILSPSASAKITGSRGKTAYGVLLAGDTGENPFHTNEPGIGDSRFAVARLKYFIGEENFLGVLYSGHTGSPIENRSAALDGYWRFSNHTIRFTGIGTFSTDTTNENKSNDGAGETISYNYISRPLSADASLESFSRNFRMDTAFYNRTGFHRAWMNVSPNFFPEGRFGWIKKISPYANGSFVHDLTTGLDDHYLAAGTNLNFSRQGSMNFNFTTGRESWGKRMFDRWNASIGGNIQMTSRIRFSGQYSRGKSIYYQAVDSYSGRSTSYSGDLEYQPIDRFRQALSVSHSDFSRLSDGYRAYSVNIVNSRTTLQFNRYFFVRVILQYDSGRDRLLQDLLASFTLIPGTVMQLGYGGISQRSTWTGEKWVQDGAAPLYSLDRRLFFKTSYLYRF